jgi:hypothetical protein
MKAFVVEGAIGFGGTVIAASIGAPVPLDELLPAFVPVNMALGVSRSGLISTAGRIEAGTLGTDEGQAV